VVDVTVAAGFWLMEHPHALYFAAAILLLLPVFIVYAVAS
jgi:hypothetical protein